MGAKLKVFYVLLGHSIMITKLDFYSCPEIYYFKGARGCQIKRVLGIIWKKHYDY